jgi:hypothetical protein
MNTSAISVPVSAGQSLTHAARVAFVALAIVALLAVSFLLGRTTVSSAQHLPSIAPTTGVSTILDACRFGRPC